MHQAYQLLLRWCYMALEGVTQPDIPLVVEQQLNDYDLYHHKHNMPALTDEQWGDLQDALITHIEEDRKAHPELTPLEYELYGG